jgi:hypothetical protein
VETKCALTAVEFEHPFRTGFPGPFPSRSVKFRGDG